MPAGAAWVTGKDNLKGKWEEYKAATSSQARAELIFVVYNAQGLQAKESAVQAMRGMCLNEKKPDSHVMPALLMYWCSTTRVAC